MQPFQVHLIEREYVRLRERGYKDPDIAERWMISERTLYRYKARFYIPTEIDN